MRAPLAPSNVNAQLEECPVLLIIGRGSFGIRQYAPKASIKETSLDSGTNYRRS